MQKNLSVRETERLAAAAGCSAASEGRAEGAAKSADVVALEKELTDALGMKVELEDEGEGRGLVTIYYRSLEQLDHVCRKMKR